MQVKGVYTFETICKFFHKWEQKEGKAEGYYEVDLTYFL